MAARSIRRRGLRNRPVARPDRIDTRTDSRRPVGSCIDPTPAVRAAMRAPNRSCETRSRLRSPLPPAWDRKLRASDLLSSVLCERSGEQPSRSRQVRGRCRNRAMCHSSTSPLQSLHPDERRAARSSVMSSLGLRVAGDQCETSLRNRRRLRLRQGEWTSNARREAPQRQRFSRLARLRRLEYSRYSAAAGRAREAGAEQQHRPTRPPRAARERHRPRTLTTLVLT